MTFMKNKLKRFAGTVFPLILALSFIAGCSLFAKKQTLSSPETIYEKGVEYYRNEKYRDAIPLFQRVKEEYPLSKYALLAELGIADSYFSEDQFIEAETAYSEFTSLHPTNPNLPYVIYQLGMCHYKQLMLIDRDQSETIKAKKEFERLTSQFPSSKFSALSERKIRDCRQRLAEHEFYVGHFYFKSKHYKAAIKRFEIVAKDYPNLGLDYKVGYFIAETKKRIEIQEKEKLAKERGEKDKDKLKEMKNLKKEEMFTPKS